MKIAYSHLISQISSKPSIEQISDSLFQLGHEHEIDDAVFNLELTPNRGDCLSVDGLLTDLSALFDVDKKRKIYNEEIKPLSINFTNKSEELCSNITFMKIEIDEQLSNSYKGDLRKYFDDLKLNKNNLFTDISNYISYETGQPTHCYDANKLTNSITLETIKSDIKFETLLGSTINLKGNNLVFTQDDKVINLAGIMGGKNTSCSSSTRSVIIEAASFNPEHILGKAIKYGINSEAAHKFERGVDPTCHEKILRRFIKILSDHANIFNVELVSYVSKPYEQVYIPFDINNLNNVLGTSVSFDKFKKLMTRIKFEINDDHIIVPPHRNDIKTLNDLAEEVARIIGYDNIKPSSIKLPQKNIMVKPEEEAKLKLKNLLIDNGFYEVINNPFTLKHHDNSVLIDNPLDSNKNYLRTNIENSLYENLLYNERRQKDTIKLFEISDIYSLVNEEIQKKTLLGIICSGRVNKNYRDFSKKIDQDYIEEILKKINLTNSYKIKLLERDHLSKSKNKIVFAEIKLDEINENELTYSSKSSKDINKSIDFKQVSEYPSSSRDLSFSVKEINDFYDLQDAMLNFKNKLIRDIFIFDFFVNSKNEEIKVGFRFIFQSLSKTITDVQVNEIMEEIVNKSLTLESVSIPGLSD